MSIPDRRGRDHLIAVAVFILFLSLIGYACAPAKHLRTYDAAPAEITGTYTLILYGARYSDDVETLAILDPEDDPYSFEPYAPDFDYKVKKEVPAREALAEAQGFVSFHHSFSRSRITKILGPAGETLGYEVRPLYLPLEFGYSDILDVSYWISGSKVMFWVTLTPDVKRRRDGDGRPLLFKWRW